MVNLIRMSFWLGAVSLLAVSLGEFRGGLEAQTPATKAEPGPQPGQPAPPPRANLGRPTYSQTKEGQQLPAAQPEATDKALPINLATALRLAGRAAAGDRRSPGGRASRRGPVAAGGGVVAAHRLPRRGLRPFRRRHPRPIWHLFINTREELMLGGGMTMVFAATDAIFLPLAQRQVVKAGVRRAARP